ncbi:MAG: MFS transporter [Pseudomonadota bacterium]
MPQNSPDPSSPFSIPVFRAVWITSMASNFGWQVQAVGAAWLMISLAASPLMVALVQASIALPIVLLSIFSGAIADSVDRRKVMLGAQFFMLLVSLILAAGAWFGLLSPWILLALTFLLGCGIALYTPSWQTAIGDMVPRATIPRAVALNSMSFNLARSFGPALGGAIVAAAGAMVAFLVNALSYVGLIVVLWRWRPAVAPSAMPRERIGNAVMAGLRYAAMSPTIGVILLRALLFGLGASAVPALLPLVARDLIHGGPLTYGMLLGGFGAGAVSGALGSTWLRGKGDVERIVRIGIAMTAAGAAGVAANLGLIPTLIALALSGGGWVIALSTFNATVQMSTPRWVTGRALSFYQMAAFAGMTAGSWAFGTLSSHLGLPLAHFIAAGWLALVTLAGFVLPMPSVEKLNLDPLDHWAEPETALAIDGRSGPIAVTIEYQIREGDVAAFLEAMDERARIRRRDGARNWSLARDLAKPELWIERYQVPTWSDYVRHNLRRTREDASNIERVIALHAGGSPPRIRRTIERQTNWPWLRRSHAARQFADPLTDVSQIS